MEKITDANIIGNDAFNAGYEDREFDRMPDRYADEGENWRIWAEEWQRGQRSFAKKPWRMPSLLMLLVRISGDRMRRLTSTMATTYTRCERAVSPVFMRVGGPSGPQGRANENFIFLLHAFFCHTRRNLRLKMGNVFSTTTPEKPSCNLIKVRGVSGKGKNRVREHGQFWQVVLETDSAACRQGQKAFLVVPVGARWVDSCLEAWWRWVSLPMIQILLSKKSLTSAKTSTH